MCTLQSFLQLTGAIYNITLIRSTAYCYYTCKKLMISVTSAFVTFLTISQKLVGKVKAAVTWTDSVICRALILLDITLKITVRITSVLKKKLCYILRVDLTFIYL